MIRLGSCYMARKHFGTDGIRGRANSQITADMALKVGQAAGLAFRRGDHRHRVVIGKDTRLSSYMIEYALVAGFASVGADVLLLGPVPTPAVAMLTRSMRCDLGVMISASHNLYPDNGIKLFGPDGYKLSDEVESEIEQLIESDFGKKFAKPAALGGAQAPRAGGGACLCGWLCWGGLHSRKKKKKRVSGPPRPGRRSAARCARC